MQKQILTIIFLETLSRLHALERGLEIRCHPGNRDAPFASKFGKVKSLWKLPTKDLLAFGRETSTDSACLDLAPFWGFLLRTCSASLLGCWTWLWLWAWEERARNCVFPCPLGFLWSPAAQKCIKRKVTRLQSRRNRGRIMEKNTFKRSWVREDTYCYIKMGTWQKSEATLHLGNDAQ